PQHSSGLNGNTVVSPSHSEPAESPLTRVQSPSRTPGRISTTRPITSYPTTTSPSPKTSITSKTPTNPSASTTPTSPRPSHPTPSTTPSTTVPSSPSTSPPSTTG